MLAKNKSNPRAYDNEIVLQRKHTAMSMSTPVLHAILKLALTES